MANDGIQVPGEGTEGHLSPSVVEERARAKGWKPREESDLGDDRWVNADEFLKREPLFETIRGLKKELNNIKHQHNQEISQISLYIANMQKIEFEKALKQLRAEKQVAIREENVAALDHINEEIRETEKAYEKAAAIKPVQPAATNNALVEEFTEWRSQNKWFDDPELQKETIAIGTGYAQLNPGTSQLDILKYATDRIKKIYPEKFQKPKNTEPMDNKVEGAGNSGNTLNKTQRGWTKADLNEVELKVMGTLIRSGALKAKAEKNKISQEEQYLKDLTEVKGPKGN